MGKQQDRGAAPCGAGGVESSPRHSQLPWRKGHGRMIEDAAGFVLGELTTSNMYTPANAEFIVRAVNCHDELVVALRGARAELEMVAYSRRMSAEAFKKQPKISAIDDAIAKATARSADPKVPS